MNFKIAAVTEDGVRLSSHFGMAPFYRVYTIQEGVVVHEEQREKPCHNCHSEGGSHDLLQLPDHNHDHKHDHHHAPGGHAAMFAPIADCQILLCGGMGSPAYQKALNAGLEVVLLGGELNAAVARYLAGTLQSDLRRIHQHV